MKVWEGAYKNYPVHKLEFKVLKWVVVDKFPDYLYGAKFLVHSDNNTLTYVLISTTFDTTEHQWLFASSTDDVSLWYQPGLNNADSLYFHPLLLDWWRTIPESGVKAMCPPLDPTDQQMTAHLQSVVDQLDAPPEAIFTANACFTNWMWFLYSSWASLPWEAQYTNYSLRETYFISWRRDSQSHQLNLSWMHRCS